MVTRTAMEKFELPNEAGDIVGMVVHDGVLYIAGSRRLYSLDDQTGELTPVEFATPEPVEFNG